MVNIWTLSSSSFGDIRIEALCCISILQSGIPRLLYSANELLSLPAYLIKEIPFQFGKKKKKIIDTFKFIESIVDSTHYPFLQS